MRGLARGHFRRFFGKLALQSRERSGEVVEIAGKGGREGLALGRGGETRLPGLARRGAAAAGPAPFGEHRLRNLERRIRPAEALARRRHLVLAERGAMGGRGALLAGRAIADGGAAGDQHRPLGVAGAGERGAYRVGVVAIAPVHLPAEGAEARRLVVGNREIGGPVDRDAVVVEQHHQPRQAQVTGERSRLVADALHQAAVADDHIGAVRDQRIAEARRQHALGERHADAVGEPLGEGPGGGLDAAGKAVFGMPGGAAAELAEGAQLVDGHVRMAGEMEHRIKQHRAVAGGQHQPVAVGPVGGGGIEAEESMDQHGGDIGHAHGHAGMA